VLTHFTADDNCGCDSEDGQENEGGDEYNFFGEEATRLGFMRSGKGCGVGSSVYGVAVLWDLESHCFGIFGMSCGKLYLI
jgi:hypothetical protein